MTHYIFTNLYKHEKALTTLASLAMAMAMLPNAATAQIP